MKSPRRLSQLLLVSACVAALPVGLLAADGEVVSHQKISDTQGGFNDVPATGSLDDGDRIGRSLDTIGDLDGDGVVDLVAAASWDDDGGVPPNANRGAVWVLFLNADGTVKAHQKISDLHGLFLGALDDVDLFGHSVTALGDLDGDTVLDIAVGATRDDDGGADRGALWILFLNADGTVKAHQKISATDGGFTGTLAAGDDFGSSGACLGDLDGDGVDDLAVGAQGDNGGGPNHGAVWILFMNSDGTVKAHQKIHDGVGGFTGTLNQGDEFGCALASLGDLDNDGVTDLAVGAAGDDEGADAAGTSHGAVWILFLNADGTVKSHTKIDDSSGGFTGVLDKDDFFGISLANVGDLDCDAVPELAVGAQYDDDGGLNRGAVWLLFLNTDGTVKAHQKISNTVGNFTATLDDWDQLASSVAPLGDLDGDEVVDMAAGAYYDDDGGSQRGAVYVMFLDGDPCLVPAVLQGFASRWLEDRVEIRWSLHDATGALEFAIQRREATEPGFVAIDAGTVTRHGDEFVFADASARLGVSYVYRVVVVEDGAIVTSFETAIQTPAATFSLAQNHPNPFNPSTRIDFVVERRGHVRLEIFDVGGRSVATLVDQQLQPGAHFATWSGLDNGRAAPSGIYYYVLEAGGQTSSRKAVLLR